jgi:hypothetical protein
MKVFGNQPPRIENFNFNVQLKSIVIMTALANNNIESVNASEIRSSLMAAKIRRAERHGERAKTLREEVAEIVGKKTTKAQKTADLIKIGLNAMDVETIIKTMCTQTRTRSQFTFSTLTFGVEIECYHANRHSLLDACQNNGVAIQSQGYNHTDSRSIYKIVSDGSLSGVDNNEVVSPILKGNKGLNSLQKLCASLETVGARVNRSCGLHVHIGAEKMSDAHFVRIVRNYQALESVIDGFMPESRRGTNGFYCKTLQGLDLSGATSKQDVISILGTRYRKVNAEAYLRHKTIEFRQHAGTVEYDKIAKWIGFLAALIQFSYEHEIAAGSVSSIEDIPFLPRAQKQYFIDRRNTLNS